MRASALGLELRSHAPRELPKVGVIWDAEGVAVFDPRAYVYEGPPDWAYLDHSANWLTKHSVFIAEFDSTGVEVIQDFRHLENGSGLPDRQRLSAMKNMP